MVKKQEINLNEKKYQWDLKKSVFKKGETPESVMNEWYKACLKLYTLSKDLYRSGNKLLNWIETYIKTRKLHSRFSVFLSEKLDNFPKATKWKSLDKKFNDLSDKLSKKRVNYTFIILSHMKQIKKLLQTEQLKQYKRLFESDFFMYKDHLITNQDARALELVESGNSFDIIHDGVIQDCRAVKPNAIDSKGKRVEADYYADLFTSHDANIRKTAYVNYLEQYWLRKETFASMLYVKYFRSMQNAKIHNFRNDLQWAMHDTFEIKMHDFLKMLSMVPMFKDLNIRYKDHKFGVLNGLAGFTKTEPWDQSLWTNFSTKVYTPEEAKTIVSKAFECFGPEFSKITNGILNSKLIKWVKGSDSTHGNFTITAGGDLNKEPIQVNFDGSVYSVSSLAHELGHSIAYYYVKRSQKTYHSLPRLLAEVPSCVCEMVCLFYMWLNEKNDLNKLAILNTILGTFFDCICGFGAQVLFKEKLFFVFEKDGCLSAKQLRDGFYYFQKNYDGITKIENSWYLSEQYQYWLYRFHFYNGLIINFEQNRGIMYYIGMIVAILLAPTILCNKDKNKLNSFLNFIKIGGTKKPFDTMKALKIDLLDSRFYKFAKENILQVLKSYETFPTLNKPGSLRFGKNNQFKNTEIKEKK